LDVQNALQNLPEPTIYVWIDSTVALYWIRGEGQCFQFVANRVSKIKQHPEIRWRHVLTKDNPADIASQGGPLSKKSLWWNGPESWTILRNGQTTLRQLLKLRPKWFEKSSEQLTTLIDCWESTIFVVL
jgi:hypothetical protein